MRYSNLWIVVFLVHLENGEVNCRDGKQIPVLKSLYETDHFIQENPNLTKAYTNFSDEISGSHSEQRRRSIPYLKDTHYGHELSRSISVKSNVSNIRSSRLSQSLVPPTTVISNILFSLIFSDYKFSVISDMIWKLLEMEGCNPVMITADGNAPLVSVLLRYFPLRWKALTAIDLSRTSPSNRTNILKEIWTQSSSLCQTLIVDLTAVDDDGIFRYLEDSTLWLWPHANIVLIGNSRKARSTLQQASLRNALKILYVGLENAISASPFAGPEEHLQLYTRCLFCNRGQPKVLFLFSWVTGSTKPQEIRMPDDTSNLQGHLIRVASFAYSPYADYIQNKNGPGGIVVLLDSLDKRILEEVSAKMNFRYEVRSPKEMRFGFQLENGSWAGAVGAIYKKEADITTTLSFTSERFKVIDHKRTIEVDKLVIISAKPELLPQYLVFFRPFTGDVWLYLMFTIMLWGTSLWILQRIWAYFSNNKIMTFNTAIFYSWAVILEDPPSKPPHNITGQMLVGWWLFTCLLITTGFKSSLVAHLTVESKTPPVDSYKDLVDRPGWKWGIDKQLISGMVRYYFRDNIHADVRYIYKHREEVDHEDGLRSALKGGYSYLATRNRMQYVINSFYADEKGSTPFYYGKQTYEVAPDLGWGFRKGAPFRSHISKLINYLIEGGLNDYWMQDVIASKVRRNRIILQQEDKQQENIEKSLKADDQLTLRMIHMMGVYLIFITGMAVASLVFTTEKLIHVHSPIS